MTRNLSAHPAWLLKPQFQIFAISPTWLKILLSLLLLSHLTISKFHQLATWNFSGLQQSNLILVIGRNYLSVIIISSNITVLVSHNIICFGYFMPMSHGVSKKAPTIVSPPPNHIFTRFVIVLQEILYQLFFALV